MAASWYGSDLKYRNSCCSVIGAVLVTFPRCVDTYAATKQATVTSLQGVVDGVLDDDRLRWFWLRFMPGVYLLVDRRDGFVLIDKPPRLLVAWFGVE
jgi:hypothetical protein